MSPKTRDHNYWSISPVRLLQLGVIGLCVLSSVWADMQMAPLTACQHLRQAETRRSRALSLEPSNGRRAPVRIPKCTHTGDFEPVQCSNEISGTECWCVDAYGVEVTGTRRDADSAPQLECPPPASVDPTDDTNSTADLCPASSCRMYCPAGFARDERNGCPKCQCRDPCDGIDCPGGQSCQLQEVTCATEPCPPVPTCKKARSLSDLCPAGQPLTIADTPRPFLCGHEPGKPQCPPIYRCLVQSGNDYGVCCPAAITFQKPGQCPRPADVQRTADAGHLCGSPCAGDLECPGMEKCCDTAGCGRNCRQPHNVSACHQARLGAELMSIGEREGRGYVPECDEGGFARRQCSRNGLVCWCVDQRTGHKMRDTMGAALEVNCERLGNAGRLANKLDSTMRSQSRSISSQADPADGELHCDQNICAAVCEYGFKIDHAGCPTCECAEPCEGFRCAAGSHCEVARDEQCASGSTALCASEPVCRPDLVYTNPCAEGVPLASNRSGEVMYCRMEEQQSREFQSHTFWDALPDADSSRALSNLIECPADYLCTKLPRESDSVCCPQPSQAPVDEPRPQSMCEYLRDFSDRMEGTEAGMVLALPTPTCKPDGHFEARICQPKTVHVTRAQRTRMLEEQNVREMRKLFAPAGLSRMPRSAGENLRLFKVDGDSSSSSAETATPQLDVKSLIRYLRQHGGNTASQEATYMAEILSRKLLSQAVHERSAKVIDVQALPQNLDRGAGKIAGTGDRVRASRPAPPINSPLSSSASADQLIPVQVDECFCVDGFGTEIPQSRGLNVTLDSCNELRTSLDCLDITCRMGCDYGFILDPETRCPTCECRDPCDSVACPDGQECRSVEVSCEGEYCPPVPACLPRKPGQCPFLVPPGTEGSTIDSCEYECRSDQHCAGTLRCCSNGCGTQCVEPQLKTACQHLQTIQLHQASELGVPPKQQYIAQCNATSGGWLRVQCGPGAEVCWCVDSIGNELSGTRRSGQTEAMAAECEEVAAATAAAVATGGEEANVAVQSRRNDACASDRCTETCEFGYVVDANGCRTCQCRDPCAEIRCPGGEQCQLMRVECIDRPCPKMPVCVPQRESVCSEGAPFRRNGQDLVCGPQGDADACPSTHTCQLDVASRRGVCCAKTRDVCFESVDNGCVLNNGTGSVDSLLTWRFSPKQNKCVQMMAERTCQSKNLFHSETACSSVCPVLSACERLRLRNSLAGKRLQQSTAWFQPRCDPETGSWSPVQCLGKSTSTPTSSTADTPSPNGVSRAFSVHEPPASASNAAAAAAVCWCADKKGAPLQGSLTRGSEPTCNHRQARRRMLNGAGGDRDAAILHDPMIEQLIGQITLIAEEDNLIETEYEDDAYVYNSNSIATAPVMVSTTNEHRIITEGIDRIDAAINPSDISGDDHQLHSSTQRLQAVGTRCEALRRHAPYPVACTSSGAFEPQQCTDEAVCWCVDAAGNQLPQTSTFSVGATLCPSVPIDTVAVSLLLPNQQQLPVRNLYDIVRSELHDLLGGQYPTNLRVHEQAADGQGGAVHVQFDLTGTERTVDTAFALEEMVRQRQLRLVGGRLRPDATMSRFEHRTAPGPQPGPQSAALRPESTFQMIVFVLASSSAFLVSIFVVFVMLKRAGEKGASKMMMTGGGGVGGGMSPVYDRSNGKLGTGDKFLDYSSPIFVLSASEIKLPNEDEEGHQQ